VPNKLSLLDKDFCEQGHDITNKDESLHLYEYRGKTILRCRRCATERTKRYYAEHIKGKVGAGFGKSKAERKAERAKNNAEPRTPSQVKMNALTLALRNEIYVLSLNFTDAELMELVLTLREKRK
jgi:uncharacterized C2H2 Zn-finger protein